MIFKLKPKHEGRELGVELPFSGTRQEAYNRAKELAQNLSKTLRPLKFTIRIDRTDAPGQGYEVNESGNTVE